MAATTNRALRLCAGGACIALLLILGATRAQDSVPGPPVPTRPESRDLEKTLAEVREVFKEEYAVATPVGRVSLSQKLLSQADNSVIPAERWVFYSESVRLAVEGGSVEAAFNAIAKWERFAAIEGDAIRIDALSRLVPKVKAADSDGVARMALGLAKKRAEAGAANDASKCLAVAATLARKSGNKSLIADVTRYQQGARDLERESKERAAIEATIAASPRDPQVCLDAGRFFCFKADDWDRGIPLLATGADSELKRLALSEAGASEPNAVIAAADAWWAWAEHERGTHKTAAMIHAADLYASILPQLQGLDRARLAKRIEQAQAGKTRIEKTLALATLPVKAVHDAWRGVERSGKHMDKTFYCLGKTWPEAMTTTPSSKSPRIAFDVPDGYRRVKGRVGIFTFEDDIKSEAAITTPVVFEIILDGVVAWQSESLSRRNQTEEFEVSLAGARQLELRTRLAQGGDAKDPWGSWLEVALVR